MIMRHIILLLTFSFFISYVFGVNADTYLWVDENGLTHATSKMPPAGAKVLKHLDEINKEILIPRYFPNQTLSENQQSDESFNRWFSKYLYKMKEPVISESISEKQEVYRFLWLRTFDAPICIRLNVNPDTPSTVSIKATNGSGGYITGELIKNSTSMLSKEQMQEFFDKIDNCHFWTLNPKKKRGFDGAEWVIEGVKNNKYHVVHIWSPEPGDCIREIGMLMMELSNHSETKIY